MPLATQQGAALHQQEVWGQGVTRTGRRKKELRGEETGRASDREQTDLGSPDQMYDLVQIT